jgi:amino acid adenylation domain-containing protein
MSSARQRRWWLLERLGVLPELAEVVCVARCAERLDAGAVLQALEIAVDRHPLFRLRFAGELGTKLEQVTAPPPLMVLETPGLAREALAEWLAREPPLRMQEGGLLRCAVLVGAHDTIVVARAHRSLADARTLDLFLCEALDQNGVAKPDGAWREPSAERKQQAVAAVRHHLARLSEPAELCGDRPRPVVQDLRARSSVYELEQRAYDATRALARSFEVEEEAVLLAAFSLLVGRYTRKREVLLGRHVLGRAEGDGSFGPFDNDVVFRARLGERSQLTVRQFVTEVQCELSESEPFEQVPFEDVLEELAPPRDASRAPIFQIGFAFEVRPTPPRGWALVDAPRRASALDLSVEIQAAERADGLLGAKVIVTEAEGLFTDQGRASRLVGHLATLLVGMAHAPDAALDALPLVTEEEHQLLVHGVNPSACFLSDDTIGSRIQRAAAARPEAEAVVCGSERLTYAELESRASRLARKLRDLGVGHGDRVGVCMERSPRLIVVLYAILKAGGGYVPIEPSQPAERAAFLLADAEPKVVLVEGEALAENTLPVLRLEDLEDELPWFSDAPLDATELPDEASAADALAYVIYTSGSTGRPKGCLVNHRHVIRLLDATKDWFHFDDNDVWTMFHSVAFDFSVWEIWGALTHGGRLVIVPQSVTRSPDEFRRLVAEEGVTVLNQTPSAFRQFIDADARGDGGATALRLVIFGGEALELESLRPWFHRHGDKRPRLVNMYGITETTVHVTHRPLSWADLDAGYASVIGVPIPDLRCYVVDEALNLVPVGVPGELLVGGAGVSAGYWKRPALNDERFLRDPFAGFLGSGRLYRSGDLVRRLPSGELDYLGRIDQQVKIRGFRIETSEVEAALRRSGMVSDVFVIAAKKTAAEAVLVAYVVTESSPHELRLAARAALPEYMVPAVFVPVDTIPLTGNGKVDRNALPDPWLHRYDGADEQYVAPRGRFEDAVARAFAEVLRRQRVSATCHFFDQGGNSLEAVTVTQRIAAELSVELPVIKIFEHSTVEALARFLEYEHVVVSHRPAPKAARGATPAQLDEAVAIVAMACRLPGAPDVPTLWSNLLEGKESIRQFLPNELDPSLDRSLTTQPAYVAARGVLDDPAGFDAAFFNMPPREAELTDPQQRLALELAWETLESAGYDPGAYEGAIGVYCGEYNVTYYAENVLKRPDVIEAAGAFQAMLGNEKDFIATRIAHKLDLRGPAVSVHTACSTSLVAVAQAFHALRTQQCDMALAGGVAITCPPQSGYLYAEGGMLSPDGHTRTFDADARGTVFSDGGAFVLLKRLSDALRDGDTVLGVLRGVATNNDGASKMSFTAPSPAGQARVVAQALAVAGVEPSTIGYVEAHGTATPLGDPIELEGLTRAFRPHTERQNYCGIGSIKSNIGHVVAAAGVAGLIKAVKAVQTGRIPPSLHFNSPNPKLDLERSPFYVVDQTTAWPAALSPRRAGVSSFGVGGTNAHVIVEEPPPDVAARPPRREAQLLLLSARSEAALDQAGRALGRALEPASPVELADAAFTLASGRRAFSERRFAVVKSGEEAMRALFAGGESVHARSRPPLAMVFSGQGSQYLAMGRALAESEPVFARALERCTGILRSGVGGPGGPLDCDLSPVLDPIDGGRERGDELMLQTAYTQPALFAVEYALAELWKHLGLEPEFLLGHSIGEITAACVAGVFSLEDALRVVMIRGRLMQSVERGVMLSVRAAVSELAGELPSELDIAAVNAPKLCVVSGPEAAVLDFEKSMAERGTATTRLRTSHAFHSPMMDPVVDPFFSILKEVQLSPPRVPIISSVTGRELSDRQATDPRYWAEHLRKTVRFADALGEVWRRAPHCLVLELGPRATLATLGRQIASDPRNQVSLPSLDVGAKLPAAADPDEQSAFLRAVGGLWSHGVALDFAAFFAEDQRRRVALPTYPFERQRYWIDPPLRSKERTDPAPPPRITPLPPRSTRGEQPAQKERQASILDALRQVLEEASGMKLQDADPRANFAELGLDSLVLTQCAQLVSRRMKCDVTFRQLSEELSTLDKLAAHLEERLPDSADRVSQARPELTVVPPSAKPERAGPAADTAEALLALERKLDLITQRLEQLQRLSAGASPPIAERSPLLDAAAPPVPGARLGRDREGNPAWYVPSPENPQKYVKLA